MLRKVRFFSSLATIYILTVGTIGAMLYSSHLFGTPVWAVTEPKAAAVQHITPKPLPPKVISGKPVRITIETSGIDLSIIDGTYDPSSETWTLSPDKAQYAVMSALANNHAGTTFIYGHGTDAVFGNIGTNHPPIGTAANIYTDNGLIFSYKLEDVKDYRPTDTNILDNTDSGAPRLVVQTCTGLFSEWRTMFIFSFDSEAKQ
jgi:hypothetical protein